MLATTHYCTRCYGVGVGQLCVLLATKPEHVTPCFLLTVLPRVHRRASRHQHKYRPLQEGCSNTHSCVHTRTHQGHFHSIASLVCRQENKYQPKGAIFLSSPKTLATIHRNCYTAVYELGITISKNSRHGEKINSPSFGNQQCKLRKCLPTK